MTVPAPQPRQPEGHSPLPWSLSRHGRYVRYRTHLNGDPIYPTVCDCDCGALPGEIEANARLIVTAVNNHARLTNEVQVLREALDKSQQALIGITSELGAIEAQMPGGLPYGIKNPKIAVDLAIVGNAQALKALATETKP